MRKNKGYRQEGKVGYFNPGNSYAFGNNKSIKQIIENVNKKIDDRIENTRKEYERVLKRTTLIGKDLYKYCRDNMLRDVKFDDNLNLIPLEEVIEKLDKGRDRAVSKELHGHMNYGWYQKRIIHKDNQKFVYNSGRGSSSYPWARIPSLKRSRQVWKRFYELFPNYEEMSHDPELRRKKSIKRIIKEKFICLWISMNF